MRFEPADLSIVVDGREVKGLHLGTDIVLDDLRGARDLVHVRIHTIMTKKEAHRLLTIARESQQARMEKSSKIEEMEG